MQQAAFKLRLPGKPLQQTPFTCMQVSSAELLWPQYCSLQESTCAVQLTGQDTTVKLRVKVSRYEHHV